MKDEVPIANERRLGHLLAPFQLQLTWGFLVDLADLLDAVVSRHVDHLRLVDFELVWELFSEEVIVAVG